MKEDKEGKPSNHSPFTVSLETWEVQRDGEDINVCKTPCEAAAPIL